MRGRILVCASACALSIGACLYPEYGVVHGDGGAGAGGPGTGGTGARGGSAGGATGASGAGGRGGAATGTAGSAGGAAGSAGRGGVGGAAGGGGGAGGTVGSAGTGGTSAPGTAGSNAGRGGGTAGRGGSAGGTGGSAGGTGGAAGGTGGAAARGGAGGVSGTGGGAGRGGTTGAGGSAGGGGGAAGSAPAPSWLPSIAVVYQFDQAPDQLGVEAHGNSSLHLEEQGSFLPLLDTTIAIEGNSAKLPGGLSNPTYLQSSGSTLPSVFRTEPTNSWTTGGWFHISATNNQQWLVHDEGPTNFQQGGFFFYVDQQVGKLSAGTAFALCRVGVASNTDPTMNNLKEVSTPESSLVGDVGFDPLVPGNWVHLVCRYNAAANELSIFVGGSRRATKVDTVHTVKSGPGPFMLGCNEPDYCAFMGNMDEVFFATSALIDADINRIYACGIDGSRCRCSGGSSYATCGFSSTSCANANLPPCNLSTPP